MNPSEATGSAKAKCGYVWIPVAGHCGWVSIGFHDLSCLCLKSSGTVMVIVMIRIVMFSSYRAAHTSEKHPAPPRTPLDNGWPPLATALSSLAILLRSHPARVRSHFVPFRPGLVRRVLHWRGDRRSSPAGRPRRSDPSPPSNPSGGCGTR